MRPISTHRAIPQRHTTPLRPVSVATRRHAAPRGITLFELMKFPVLPKVMFGERCNWFAIFREVALAVDAMHQTGVAHGALDAQHLMIDADRTVTVLGRSEASSHTAAADVQALGALIISYGTQHSFAPRLLDYAAQMTHSDPTLRPTMAQVAVRLEELSTPPRPKMQSRAHNEFAVGELIRATTQSRIHRVRPHWRPDAPAVLKYYMADAGEEIGRFYPDDELSLVGLVHPNLVTVIEGGVWDGEGKDQGGHLPYILMEPVEGIGIGSSSRPRDWRKVFSGVVRGLHAVHERGFLHLDVLARNILVDDQDHATVVDLGAMLPLDDPRIFKHPLKFGAPEIARNQKPATPAADFYQLGALIMQYREVLNLPGEITVLGERLIVEDPRLRPTAAQLLNALQG